jgi:Glycosyltransferases involved in cell wall biogenesis
MDRPKVSILIPTYRQAALVMRAVEGALAQTYTPLEVVICDDSPDSDTQALLAPFLASEPRLRYTKNASSLGRVGNYRQALYEQAQGDWVLMLDGDDFLIDTNFIADAMAGVCGQKGVVFAQGGGEIRLQAADGTQELVSLRLPDITGDSAWMNGAEYVRRFPARRRFLHLATLFHRETAVQLGFYEHDLLSSDLESLLRLALHGKVFLLKRAVGVWLWHGENASRSATVAVLEDNTRWAESVAAYASAQHFWSHRQAQRWKRQVKAHEMIGVLMREIKLLKSQNKSKKEVSIYIKAFLKRHPYLRWHPVWWKKRMMLCFTGN